MAGVPLLSAVSAPSTLAVDLAAEAGMTLVGFVRDGGMNVYAGDERVDLLVPDKASPGQSGPQRVEFRGQQG